MKKLLLLATLLAFTFQVEAQSVKQKKVPGKVVSKVEQLYPEATKTKWTMEDGRYEAAFSVKNFKVEVKLTEDGSVVLTSKEINFAKLPEDIKTYLTSKYAVSDIDHMEMETDADGNVTYEVEVNGMDFVFGNDGSLLESASEEDDDD